jgi:hypothetical protein
VVTGVDFVTVPTSDLDAAMEFGDTVFATSGLFFP